MTLPLVHQTLLIPTSYRGGYLFLLLSSSNHSFSSHLHIHSLHATSTHIAVVICHLSSQQYCLIVLDLLPTHISIPSYGEIKSFLQKFCRGIQPKLSNTLVQYLNSTPSSIQFITPTGFESKLGTSLLIGLRCGSLQFFTFQVDGWIWKPLESFNILHMHDQIATPLKKLEQVTYHPSTATITWIESIDRDNILSLRCCLLPLSLRSSLGVDLPKRLVPFTPEIIVTTLFTMSPTISFPKLLPSSSFHPGCYHFSIGLQVISSPVVNQYPNIHSSASSLSSISSRSCVEEPFSEKLGATCIESAICICAIDYHLNSFPISTLRFPPASSCSPEKIFSTILHSDSTSSEIEYIFVVAQFDSNQNQRCFFYILKYSRGNIIASDPFAIPDSTHPLRDCCASERNIILLYECESNIPMIFTLPISAVMGNIIESPQWYRYPLPTPVSGRLAGLLTSTRDSEWTLEIKKHYFQEFFYVCVYTDRGELFVLNGLPTCDRVSNVSDSLIKQQPAQLTEITEKLLLTNKFLNPNPPSLHDIKMEGRYIPHQWYRPYHIPKMKTHEPEVISFENSVITFSDLLLIPSHSILQQLKSRNPLVLNSISMAVKKEPMVLSPDDTFVYSLAATIFSDDELFLDSIVNKISNPFDSAPSKLADFFVDIDSVKINSSHQPSVRYLDIQDLFISCHKNCDEDINVDAEYLELSFWYIYKFQPMCLVNFIYEVLSLLSSRSLFKSKKVQVQYSSLGKVNKVQRNILCRSFKFLDSVNELHHKTPYFPSSTFDISQLIYLRICSFSENSVERIVHCLCKWKSWNFVVEFTCLIFQEYNTNRIRHYLGERWNNMSPLSGENCMRWENPLNKFHQTSLIEDKKETCSQDSERIANSDVPEEDNDWDNTWKDVSGSDDEDEGDKKDVDVTNTSQVDEEYMSQYGGDNSTMGMIWDDVESDDEEQSELICWKYFTKSCYSIFVICLKSLLLHGDISRACQLISHRPYVGHSERERTTDDGGKRGIRDVDILDLFDEIYEEQRKKQGDIAEEGEGNVLLNGNDLRRCIDSLVYSEGEDGVGGEEEETKKS